MEALLLLAQVVLEHIPLVGIQRLQRQPSMAWELPLTL